jgi:hypothetical protein
MGNKLNSKIKLLSYLISWGFRILINVVFGGFGLGFIIYEGIATSTGSRWSFLDSHAQQISTFLTLLGTFCTAGSIYLYSQNENTPPEKLSVYITAPIILFMCTVAMIYFISNGDLPVNTINGFALLAVGGGLLRAQPNPSKDSNIFWNRGGKESP